MNLVLLDTSFKWNHDVYQHDIQKLSVFPDIAQLVKNLPAMQETWVPSLGWEVPWRRERLPTPVLWPGEFHGLSSPGGHSRT